MDDFEIIDVHADLARTLEEESNYWLIPGRRAGDRLVIPEKVIEYMDQSSISNMAFMILIPRQSRDPLVEKAKTPQLPKEQRQKERERISQQVAALIREMNEWGCELGERYPRLLPFPCLSDDLGGSEDIGKELELRFSQGAKGIRLHPGMFSFFPDAEKFWPVYEKCEELELPILADSEPWPPSYVLATYPLFFQMPRSHIDYGESKNWIRVLEPFPHLTIILAHLGSVRWDERIERAQNYPNVYFDTSQGFSAPDRIPVVPHRSPGEEDAVRAFHKINNVRNWFSGGCTTATVGTNTAPSPD